MTSSSTIPAATFQPPAPTTPQEASPNGLSSQDRQAIQGMFDALPEDHRCKVGGIMWENARPTPSATFELVTPEMAERWLESNVHNRRFSSTRANNAASDMAAGRWMITGEAIKFDIFGHETDGQHRTEGILAAGVPVMTLVVRGLDPAAQEVMDSGARRTAGDALSLRGTTDAKEVASTVRRILQWEDGVRERRYRLGRNTVTTAEVIEWTEAHPHVLEVVSRSRAATDVPIPQSVRGLLWWLFDQIDPAQTAEFFARLGDGVGLPEDHPILTLRNKLMAERSRSRVRVVETAYLEMTIRAWNAWREGRKLIRMQISSGKDFGVPTPK
jgi:hypothetical protein